MAMRLKADDSGNVVLPQKATRQYLAVYSLTDYTIEVDGVTFTIAVGTAFAPIPTPLNAMTITGADVVLES